MKQVAIVTKHEGPTWTWQLERERRIALLKPAPVDDAKSEDRTPTVIVVVAVEICSDERSKMGRKRQLMVVR